MIPEHDGSESGAPELYYIAAGNATFASPARRSRRRPGPVSGSRTLAAAPAPSRSELSGNARPLGQRLAAPGQAYTPAGWDSHYLDGDKELGTLAAERPGPVAQRVFKTRTVV